MTEISPEIKGIVWDLDGTIVDSFGVFQESVSKLAPNFGLEVPTTEKIVANYHGTLEESIQSVFDHKLDDVMLEDFLHQFLTDQDILYANLEGHLLQDAVNLSRKAKEKGLKQAIVTNRAHQGRNNASPRSIVANSELSKHIHEVICGDEVTYRKPDPRVLGDMLGRWGIESHELVVVGDQFVDAQLAINLGARAIIVSRNAEELAHAHKLDVDWQDHVTIVKSLDEVVV
jgi:phosphoglycolate phosphatase-like HAD superfamily hydrolase